MTNKLKVLIVEDEKPTAEKIVQLLHEIDDNIEILDKISTVRETIKQLKSEIDIDLILLDIQLADGIAFDIFEELIVETPVIFITAYDNYAIKAFELNSIDYLLKPINREKLNTAIKKYMSIKGFFNDNRKDLHEILKIISTKEYKKRLIVHLGKKIIPIETKNIAYFYASEGNIYLKTFADKNYITDYSLDNLESLFNPELFFRINRQYLVNYEAINDITSYSNYQLKLELNPTIKDYIFVSKKKTIMFKNWLHK